MRLSALLILAFTVALSGCAAKTAVESLVRDLSATGQVGLVDTTLTDQDRFDQRNDQHGNGNTSTQQVITTQDPALIHALEQISLLTAGLAGVWVLAFVLVMMQLGARLGQLGRELTGLREDTRQNTLAVERIPADTARALTGAGSPSTPRAPELQVV